MGAQPLPGQRAGGPYLVRECAHVPRIGEFIDFGTGRSYVVADVVWWMYYPQRVTAHVFQRSWHQNFDQVIAVWRSTRQREGG